MSSVEGGRKGNEVANLDNLSQATHMTVWTNDEGKCVIKSVVNSSQSFVGVAMGWSGLMVSY